MKPREQEDFEPFTINRFVKKSLNVGSDIISVQAVKETYPYLAFLDNVAYSYKNIEMILGQDVCHAIRQLEYISANENLSSVAVRLPIGWVLSGPLPSSSCLTSAFFKVKIEHDNELASQVKSCYDIEESTTILHSLRYDVGMIWAADDTKFPNNYYSSLVQLKSLEKRLAKEKDLLEIYSSTIKEDLNKGFVIEVFTLTMLRTRLTKSGTYTSIRF